MPVVLNTNACAVDPRIRSRSSLCSPVIIAMARMSARTPTVTPSVETNEMIEMKAWRRRASRYRSAI